MFRVGIDFLLCIIVVRKWKKCRKSPGKRKITLKVGGYFRGGKGGNEH